MRKTRWVLLLAILLCLCACNGGDETPAELLDFASVLPDDWQCTKVKRLETRGDKSNKEWVVLYRFDMSTGSDLSGYPIKGVVYQPDDRRPPCIVPYELRPKNGGYLCEHKCDPVVKDVLSEPQDTRELVVRDHNDEEVVRLSIFRWNEGLGEDGAYESLGYFPGDRVAIASDTVTVTLRFRDRAQLAAQSVYHPHENTKTYYMPGDEGVPVPADSYEVVFYHGEPEEIMLSPYPEKVVLAFYHHYAENASDYFTAAGWGSVEECAPNRCGCSWAHDEVKRVRVTYVEPISETCDNDPAHQCEDHGFDHAVVEGTVRCEKQDGTLDDESRLQWDLVREDDRWKIDQVEIEKPEEEAGEEQ